MIASRPEVQFIKLRILLSLLSTAVQQGQLGFATHAHAAVAMVVVRGG